MANIEVKIGTGGLTLLGVGAGLAVLGLAGGLDFTAEIPATNWNVSLGIAAGDKEDIDGTLAGFIKDEMQEDDNFWNWNASGHLAFIGGTTSFTVGEQPDAPAIGAKIDFDK